MKRTFLLLLFAVMVLAPTSPRFVVESRADLPGQSISVWNIRSHGIWRREVRRREIARWYRHYEWRTDLRLWLKRRAEGVWIRRDALTQFTCRSHCVIQNPNGPGVWRIWRLFRRTDVRRFRMHLRTAWVGHLNPVVGAAFPDPEDPDPLNGRFALSIDQVEIVTPMEPADPDPGTPGINENVEIMDENGVLHFLGEPGFEVLPDTAMNPNGFQLATTAMSTEELPQDPTERISDPDFPPQPGHVEIAPGVVVEWLADDFGNVLVDDGTGVPADMLDPRVMGDQRHQSIIGDATGIDGNELSVTPNGSALQLACWALDENGEVLGALPGQVIIGPPTDLNADGEPDQGAIGAPIPMDPTVRDEFDQRDPTAQPVEFAVVEEDEPTAAELQQFNQLLQQAGFAPVFPPFKLCIRQLRLRQMWGIDRRFVMDTWYHHWQWLVAHHFNVTVGVHRVWLTRAALASFSSSHHHYVVGQPPTWYGFNLTQVRFFRVCYRIYCPRPGVLRARIDQLWMTVPIDPDDPGAGLMMITTESNENNLLPAGVLAGTLPDPLPVGPDGVFVEELDPILGAADVLGGGNHVFDGDLTTLPGGGMQDITVVGNEDLATALRNNQLQLYCWVLNADGTLARETFAVGKGGPPLSFTISPTPAIPEFFDEMTGQVEDDATMLSFQMMATPTGDPNTSVRPAQAAVSAYPNPFNPQTTIEYAVDRDGPVSLSVYDLRGRKLLTLVKGDLAAGVYTVPWDGRDANGVRLASGTYFATLRIGEESTTHKVVLAK